MLEELFELSRQLIQRLNFPYQRYLMHQNAFSSRCTILTGQRGVGKTTCLVQHLLKKDPDYRSSQASLYLPVDHFLVSRSSLYEVARDFSNQGGKLLCLDEIHKYSGWSRDLKSIVDTFPKLHVIASGSSMLHLHRGTHDLSRRAVLKKLEGLSFREFLELRLKLVLPALPLEMLLKQHEKKASMIAEAVEKKGSTILKEFYHYLESGFYPYSREYADLLSFQITLEQGLHTTLESDLPALYPNLTGTSMGRIKRLLVAIAENVPYTPDLIHLRKLLHITDDRTLKDYLHYLEDAGLIMMIHRSGKKIRAMEKPDKIYLGDPNQNMALTRFGKSDQGTLRETFFCRTLLARHSVTTEQQGDFLVDGKFVIEVGGRAKGSSQITGLPNAYLALDNLPVGSGKRVPLWLFGFLY